MVRYFVGCHSPAGCRKALPLSKRMIKMQPGVDYFRFRMAAKNPSMLCKWGKVRKYPLESIKREGMDEEGGQMEKSGFCWRKLPTTFSFSRGEREQVQ